MRPDAIRTSFLAGGLAAACALCALPAHAATDPYSAFVFSTSSASEPAIYDFIDSAKSTLDMTMYEITDTTAVNDLVAREKAGVKVRVVLDGRHTSYNSAAIAKLKAAGVGVVESNTSRFTYTHQKTITVDGAESLILTGNLTSQYYTTSCDYGSSTATRPTSRPSRRSSTPTTRTRRSPRATAPTCSGRPPRRRAGCCRS